ncbi:MAG: hypothetical protein M1837_000834 [Sclerophora amabilis]|nr:MAG: hypothetical protein M1837_000834 [Sclerophora amabilis]
MFVEPTATAPKEPKSKADPSAPARSSIRRTRSVRYPRAHDGTSPGFWPTHRPSSRMRREHLIEFDNDIAYASGLAHRSLPPPLRDHEEGSASLAAIEADEARTEASNRRRQETGRALLRDALSYERPNNVIGGPGPSADHSDAALPIVPEPADFARQRSTQDLYSNAARQTDDRGRAVVPYSWDGTVVPYAHRREIGSSRSSPLAGGDTSSPGPLSRTPRFAPAYRFGEPSVNFSHPHREPQRRHVERYSRDSRDAAAELRSHARQYFSNDMPPLRRMGHRSIAEGGHNNSSQGPSHRPVTVDGLGDRERSLSPDDSWETLLMTIAPDQRLPSNDSSFTSATASASASSLGSNPTSRSTPITVPSETEMPPICDLWSASDSEYSESDTEGELEEEAENGANPPNNPRYGYDHSHGSNRQRHPPHHHHHHHHHHLRHEFPLAHPSSPPHPRSRDGRANRHPRVRDQDEALTNDLATEAHDMQRILDRLARREDIPDEWWAAAGLSRDWERLYRERL